jgi:prolyl oligopeptidase
MGVKIKLIFFSSILIFQIGCASMQKDEHVWLEEIYGEKQLNWVKDLNAVTEKHFSQENLLKQLESDALKIMDNKDRIPMINFVGQYVYNFWTDNKNPRGLYRRTTFADYKKKSPKWEIVIDIDELNKKESKSWVFRGCSTFKPDFSRCLMALSDAGRDAAEVREFDLKTKSFVKDGFYLPVGKHRYAWLDENTLLVATDRDPKTVSASGYPLHMQKWKRGTDLVQAPTVFLGEKTDMSVYAWTQCRPEGCYTSVGRVINFYENELYFLKSDGSLDKVNLPPVFEPQGYFKNELYINLIKDLELDGKKFSKGSLLKCPIGQWKNLKEVFVPTEKQSFQSLAFSRDHIFLNVLNNVIPQILRDGVAAPVPGIGNASIAEVDEYSNRSLINFDSPILPSTLYEWDGNKFQELKKLPAFFDAKNLEVVQLEAKSKDGTGIPYFLIRSQLTRGPAPTIISAYGGFQIPLIPGYEAIRGKLWIERGGQVVIPNIRGGGEFGPRWHEGALKEKRQNAYDDLFAVTEDLFEKALTTSDRVGMVGGSNGGLLAGVAFTQKPEMYKAIVSQVPLLDMYRYHKLLAGHSWIAEYGNPDDPQDWAYISKYSPYHNLKSGIKYPSLFLMTSTRDDRVHPAHARKFAARLSAMNIPFRYFENIEGGHGGAADLKQRAKYIALQYAFFLEQLK